MSLIYSMLMSVDGYVEDEHGRFDFAVPDEEVNPYINQLTSRTGSATAWSFCGTLSMADTLARALEVSASGDCHKARASVADNPFLRRTPSFLTQEFG